jgi:2-amino-4-hydroxy-6-hydroxymethyldihydropteridine diphosphokinase
MATSPTVTAYVALGSNLGDREANLQQALSLLGQSPQVRLGAVSDFFDNPAVGGPADSPVYLNAVVEISTTLPPRELLNQLLTIEQQMGRVRREKWAPRNIDLDIVLYGDQIIDEPDLQIPHPLMHERAFVLIPLKQIAPDAYHPVKKCRIDEL